MTEERSPLEVALDLFVFAPVGILLTLTEDLPKLVEKGRGRIESQLGMARIMGELAAPQLQTEATKLVKGLLDRVPAPGPPPAASRPVTPSVDVPVVPAKSAPPTSPTSPARASASAAPVPPVAPTSASAPVSPAAPGASASPAGLAIPGYDSLSAMQVVSRLTGLSRPELEAVRSYEEAHRHRKTIIHRADQLLTEAS
ncbi:MAG: hypothetical protein ACYCSJ_08975 [Acidimicrobiales bacterium]